MNLHLEIGYLGLFRGLHGWRFVSTYGWMRIGCHKAKILAEMELARISG
jgi:hypothetical protein